MWSYRSAKAPKHLATMDRVEFSIASYEPMARLMNDEDLLFLKGQPGFRPEIGKQFCRERRRIFRLYLQELARDFHRLHAHARVVAASLPAEHSALIGVLLKNQVRFWYEMTSLELRLSLSWTGLGVSSLDPHPLLSAMAAMHAEIGRLAAPAAA